MILRIALLMFVVNILIVGSVQAQNTWTQKTSLPGPSRFDATAFVIGSKGFICTGDTLNATGFSSLLNDLWEWDSMTDTWSQKANFPGLPRRGSFSFSIGSKGYVGGGSSGIQNFLDFWEYDTTSNTWTPKMGLIGPFQNHILGFAIGNFGYTIFGNFTTDLYKYDPGNDAWNVVSIFPGLPRFYATSFVIGSSIFLGTGNWYKDIWEYNVVSNSWTQKADLPGNKREAAVGFAIGNKGYIGTGFDTLGTGLSDFHEFDTTSNTWSSIANYPAGPIVYANGFAINGKGYVAMGVGFQPPGYRTLWEYSPVVGVKEISSNIVIISPNPFDDKLNVFFPHSKMNEIRFCLYTTEGNKVIDYDLNEENESLSTAFLHSGIYIYQIVNDKNKKTQSGRLVKL